MNELEVDFNFRARYFTLGNKAAAGKIWFVLHGYGQLAQYFLRKFAPLEAAGHYVIAPEGLSRYYLEDAATRNQTGNNRVGATWMTRENRLQDIHNYITYLDAIYRKEVPPGFNGQINILGFSQGAATASRWAMHDNSPFHRLILWAGVFPPDMDFRKGAELLKQKEVIEVYGTQDPFITEARLAEVTALNEKLEIHPHVIAFDGGHEIDAETLKQLI